MSFVKAMAQLLDFVWKACQAYADTPEGEKELGDVVAALESSDDSPQSATNESSYRGK